MGFTFVNMVSGASDGAAQVDASASLNVAAGDVLVAWVKHEQGDTTLAVAKDSGTPTNALTFDAGDKIVHANNDLRGGTGYLLSASADSTMTPRLTLGASRTWIRFFVLQFRPDAGETVSKDTSNAGSGSSASLSSGNITTTGDDEIAVGTYGEYTPATTSGEQINGVGATEPTGSPLNDTSVWYRILTATVSNGAATASKTGTDPWLCAVLALKSVAGAPAGRTTKNTHPDVFGVNLGMGIGMPVGAL